MGRKRRESVVIVDPKSEPVRSTFAFTDLMRQPGSVMILDPKGEITKVTKRAKDRKVATVDPLAILDGKPFAADADALAESIVAKTNPRKRRTSSDPDVHWKQSARDLLAGVVVAESMKGPVPVLALLDEFKSASEAKPEKKRQAKKPR